MPHRRAVVAALVVLLAASPLLSPALATVTRDGSVFDVRVGREERVGFGGLAYVGDREVPDCQTGEVVMGRGVCNVDGATASAWMWSTSGGWWTDAAAGVGFDYRFVSNCVGQSLDAAPRVQATYYRSIHTRSGDSWARVYVDPVTGGLEPRYPLEAGMTPRESWGADVLTERTVTVDVPWPGAPLEAGLVHSLLAHLRVHASNGAVTSGHVTFDSATFDWDDATPPWATWTLDGVPATPAHDDRAWFNATDAFLRVAPDDDFSCPRHVWWRNVHAAPAAPWVAHEVGFGKDGPAIGGAEGVYDVEFHVEDWQGNRNATTTVRFGIDATAPALAATTDPAAPNADGWFAVARPDAVLSCADATAGCAWIEWRLAGEPAWRRVTGAQAVVPLPDGAPTTLECRGLDKAGNLQASGCAVSAHVDATPPDVALDCIVGGQTAACGPAWTALAQEVALSCSDVLQATTSISYDLDGAGWTAYAQPFLVADEGVHALAVECLDAVGNAARRDETLRLDLTAPGATTATPVRAPTNVDPAWTLAATDALSGVKDFEVRVDGGPSAFVASPFVATGLGEGIHCLSARARDEAGNLGPWTTADSCILVDRTAPVVSVDLPAPGRLHLWSGAVLNLSDPAATVLQGAYTATSRARDAGAAPSGLLAWNLSWANLLSTQVDCLAQGQETCENPHLPIGRGSPAQVQRVAISAYAIDHARNLAAATVYVDQPPVVAIAHPTLLKDARGSVTIHWQPPSEGLVTVYRYPHGAVAECGAPGGIVVAALDASVSKVLDHPPAAATTDTVYDYCVAGAVQGDGNAWSLYPAVVPPLQGGRDHDTLVDRPANASPPRLLRVG